MATFLENIKRIREEYSNRNVREDMAQALEKLKAWITGLVHNSGSGNLIEYPSGSSSLSGITYEVTDDGIHVYGTATAASWLALDWGEAKLTAGKPYIANLGKSGNGAVYLTVGYFMDADHSAFTNIGSTDSVLNFTCPSQYMSSRDMIYVPSGSTVDCVVNPKLRSANEEDTTQPEVYTIEEISEKIHSGSIGGGGGGYKVVTQASRMTDTDMIYVYEGSETGYQNGYWYYHNGSTWVAGAQFNLGRDGVDGTSPTANVTSITGGARVTITDRNGTTSVDLLDSTNVDDDAREMVQGEIARATAAEEALGTRIDNMGSDWTKTIDTVVSGVTFRIFTSERLGMMFVDMFGTWSSVPATKHGWVTIGQADIFKYNSEGWTDGYKFHMQYQKDQKANVYFMDDGTVKFGQTANYSNNTDISPTVGNSCRAKYMGLLPGIISPVVEGE